VKLLITGATGYLGSALQRDLSKYYPIRGTYNKKAYPHLLPLDTTDLEQVRNTFATVNPDVVIHCAGIRLGKFNEDPGEGRLINLAGTRNIIKGVQSVGASLIYISSQSVFDGRVGAFTEKDQPMALTEFSKTKIEGEQMVQSLTSPYCLMRPSLVVGQAPYGMDGQLFGQIATALVSDSSLKLDNKWRFNLSWNRQISEVIHWWIEGQTRPDILHVGSAETMTLLELGRKLSLTLKKDPALFREDTTTPDRQESTLNCDKLKTLDAPVLSLDEMITTIAHEIRDPRTVEGTIKRKEVY